MKNFFEKLTLENRIFIYVLFATIIMSVLLIVENIIISYPVEANIKWVLSIVFACLFLYLVIINKFVKIAHFSFFIIVIVILLPLGWLNSSVGNPFTLAYSFLICIAIIYFFDDILQFFILSLEIIVVMTMLILTYVRPDLFMELDSTVQLIDTLIQVPLTFLAAIFLLQSFSKAYKNSLKTLNLQNNSLNYITLHDELTGIYNRRYIFSELNHLKETLTDSHSILIGMIDLDNFKHINDTFGHEVGDEVLIQAAKGINAILNTDGFVGRYGGDEFIIVITNLDNDNHLRILKALKSFSLTLNMIKSATTFSGGFTYFNGNSNVDAPLAIADKLLYASKFSGKNKIYLHDKLSESDLAYTIIE